MKKAFHITLIILWLGMSGSVFAVKIDTLYEGIVPVKSQSSAERHAATQKALAEVLIKVSGNNQIINNPRIKTRLATANHLVQEFGYNYPENQNADIRYLLRTRFDKSGVNQWLRDAAAPIWSQNRPQILTWIAIEQAGIQNPTLNDSETVQSILQDNAKRRGISLRIPTKDIKDRSRITASDIINMSTDKLMQASKHYSNSAILIGHMVQNEIGLTTQWKLIAGNDSWDFHVTGQNEAEVLPQMVDQVANTLAGKYAVITTNNIQKNIGIRVVGISLQEDFAKLIRYLSQLPPVASVVIARITEDEIMLNVGLRSTETAFTEAVSLSQKLLPVETDFNADPLTYKWNPL
jgi:hypothetical protein